MNRYYLAVDNNPVLLSQLTRSLEEADEECVVKSASGEKEVRRLLEEGMRPAVAFLNIDMPETDSLELARIIRRASPRTMFVFTADSGRYAYDAYRLHARGYLLRPITPQKIRGELDEIFAQNQVAAESGRLRVQTFGNFQVFFEGMPVHFSREKSKELFALLIDRRGASLSIPEIAAFLWEEKECDRALKNQVHTILSSLRRNLAEIGMDDVINKDWNQISINVSKISCDYYDSLEGKGKYLGEYMSEYSWAEFTNAALYRFN